MIYIYILRSPGLYAERGGGGTGRLEDDNFKGARLTQGGPPKYTPGSIHVVVFKWRGRGPKQEQVEQSPNPAAAF